MRNKILSILMKSKDKYVSGEDISIKLGISRTAVWKHIKALRESGYEIESATKKGYRLVQIPDILDAAVISYNLNSKIIGRKIYVYDRIDSTNIKAKELADEASEEGTIVLAEEQTAGKGRLSRKWLSPSGGGIWLSIILRPPLLPIHAPKITSMAAAAVLKAVNHVTGLECGVKWPNDIIINDKKVCGILTEMQSDIDVIKYVVVGIGINVNMTQEDLAPEIRKSATSLRIEKGSKIHRIDIIQSICSFMEEIYMDYINTRNFAPILNICREHSVTLGKKVRVIGKESEYEGRAIDLCDDGALIVEKENGQRVKVIAGDVSVRGIAGYV